MTGFERRLENEDLTLFDAIPSQSNRDDKRSWLALQSAIRGSGRPYAYLEIGSHLGGSIQPYLLDDRCHTIYSIDKRPRIQPDDRGEPCVYEDNSTGRMLANLRSLDARQVTKVVTFDADAHDVERTAIHEKPALCLIDGEHTRDAVLRDFDFCFSVCAADAVIYFHDAQFIYRAIAAIVARLRREGVRCRPFKIGGLTFAIAVGDSSWLETPALVAMSTSGRQFLWRMRMRTIRERVGRFARPYRSGLRA